MPDKTARKTTYEWLVRPTFYIFVSSPTDLVQNIIISKGVLNMIITTNDLRVKLDRFDKVQNQILEHYEATHDNADCHMINAMYYQLCKAINCLEKGMKGEFDFD